MIGKVNCGPFSLDRVYYLHQVRRTPMRKLKYNDEKYAKAVKTIARQIVAMVQEDYPEYDAEDLRWTAEDYAADTITQLNEEIDELLGVSE